MTVIELQLKEHKIIVEYSLELNEILLKDNKEFKHNIAILFEKENNNNDIITIYQDTLQENIASIFQEEGY